MLTNVVSTTALHTTQLVLSSIHVDVDVINLLARHCLLLRLPYVNQIHGFHIIYNFKVNREHHPNEIISTHVEAVQKQLEIFSVTYLQNLLVFSNQVQTKSNISLV